MGFFLTVGAKRKWLPVGSALAGDDGEQFRRRGRGYGCNPLLFALEKLAHLGEELQVWAGFLRWRQRHDEDPRRFFVQ